MKRTDGRKQRNDDEWYTPYQTALKVAQWAIKRLDKETPILCPADILPDGKESNIPKALRDVGFTNVRVTRDLPIESRIGDVFLPNDYKQGEIIITNPPFSLLVQFRGFLEKTGTKFISLARPASFRKTYTILELKDKFYDTNKRCVAGAWYQNIENTIIHDTKKKPIGNCINCETEYCPNNIITGKLKPKQDRPLYVYCHAVKLGIAGWYCYNYKVNNKRSFARFFYPENT